MRCANKAAAPGNVAVAVFGMQAALTPGTAISVTVHDTRHWDERGVRSRDKMRALKTLPPAVDDDGVFAFERRVIESKVLRAKVCGVIPSCR
jgi:hypothetical protein